MKEQFYSIMLSYFRFWGDEACKLLELFSDCDQRRILQLFMEIVEDDLYEYDNGIKIKVDVPKDLSFPVAQFVSLYHLDTVASGAVDSTKKVLINHLTMNKYAFKD